MSPEASTFNALSVSECFSLCVALSVLGMVLEETLQVKVSSFLYNSNRINTQTHKLIGASQFSPSFFLFLFAFLFSFFLHFFFSFFFISRIVVKQFLTKLSLQSVQIFFCSPLSPYLYFIHSFFN